MITEIVKCFSLEGSSKFCPIMSLDMHFKGFSPVSLGQIHNKLTLQPPMLLMEPHNCLE